MRIVVSLLLIAFMVSACSSSIQSAAVTPYLGLISSSTETIVPSPTRLPTSTSTLTPTSTATLIPTLTPTLSLPLAQAIPIPESIDPLSLSNYQNFTVLAQWKMPLDEGDYPWEKAFSPDGKWLAIGSRRGKIVIFRVQDGTIQYTLDGHSDSIWGLAFSPDGMTLYSVSGDGYLNKWDLQDGSLVNLLDKERSLSSLAISPDGNLLAIGTDQQSLRKGIHLYSIPDQKLLRSIRTSNHGWVRDIRFSSDGSSVAAVVANDKAAIWRVSDGELLQTIAKFGGKDNLNFSWLALSSDDQMIALGASRIIGDDPQMGTGYFQDETWLWNVQEQKLVYALVSEGGSIDFSASDDILLLDGEETSYLMQASDGQIIRKIDIASSTYILSPDGTLLAACSTQGDIQLWGVYP